MRSPVALIDNPKADKAENKEDETPAKPKRRGRKPSAKNAAGANAGEE